MFERGPASAQPDHGFVVLNFIDVVRPNLVELPHWLTIYNGRVSILHLIGGAFPVRRRRAGLKGLGEDHVQTLIQRLFLRGELYLPYVH